MPAIKTHEQMLKVLIKNLEPMEAMTLCRLLRIEAKEIQQGRHDFQDTQIAESVAGMILHFIEE